MKRAMRKTIIIAGAAICIICAVVISYAVIERGRRDAIPSRDLILSEYPKLFAKEAVIVIGENTSQIEKESAEAIAANLENLTGNKPEIISSKKIESFKYTYNLIIIGTPKTNPFLEEVHAMTNATRVTEEFPGEGKGVLEILRNPWDESKAMLLVEGSDEWGVKAGITRLNQRHELNKTTIIIEYKKTTPTYPPIPTCFDKNGNRIEDSLDKQIIDEKKTGTDQIVPIVVMLRQPCNKTQLNLFKKMGGEVEYVYDTAFYGFAGNLSLSKISEFTNYLGDSLYFISSDKKVELYNKNHE